MSEMIENPGMDRKKLETFILETYPASADRPWLQYPNYEVSATAAIKNGLRWSWICRKASLDCRARSG